jgi:AcrR family transcriptional regulator
MHDTQALEFVSPGLAIVSSAVETSGMETIASDPAKMKIMRTGETLFARRGIDSVSLREIATLSGNGNNNAVQYHFGNKMDLVQTIFRWRVWEMEFDRAARLEQARADGTIDDLATLLQILCLPLARQTNEAGDHSYAAFMVDYLLRHRAVGMRHAVDNLSAPGVVIREVLGRLHRKLNGPHSTGEDYRVRLAHMQFINMLVMSDSEDLPRRDPETFARRIEDTMVMVIKSLS